MTTKPNTQPEPKRRRVSLSKVRDFRHCEQLYYYRYFLKLRRKEKAAAPELGILLHEYLDNYYSGIKNENDPQTTYDIALEKVAEKHTDRLRVIARTIYDLGLTDSAVEILKLVDRATNIIRRYHQEHGLADAKRYKILLVEEYLRCEIAPGLDSAGLVDLVTVDRETDLVSIWEHKSTGSVPPQSVRLFDLQTALYEQQLMELFQLPIDSIVWNYIRTKAPVVPERLKKGGLSRDKRIDTNWQTYLDTITKFNIDPLDYQDMQTVLQERESRVYFPRYEHVIVAQGLIEDYVKTALDIQAAEESWESETPDMPVRNLSRDCEYCDMKRLCFAALTGGDEGDIIRLDFEVDTYQSERDLVHANQDTTA